MLNLKDIDQRLVWSTVKLRVLTLVYNMEINFFPKSHSKYNIKIPLQRQSEKDSMCFQPRRASTCDFTVCLQLYQMLKNKNLVDSFQEDASYSKLTLVLKADWTLK